MQNYQMVAKTLFGLESTLSKELLQLGAINIQKGIRNISFYGDSGFMYKANLCLRTALKILKPIKTFKAKSEHQLYREIKNIKWENYIDSCHTFIIESVVFSDFFNHSHFVNLKTKDAIVDRFREKTGKRPSIDTYYPTLKINLHIAQDHCTVSLDSSGESLHKRGYRVEAGKAPINEVLAAGIILLSGWDGRTDFIDPMCGSGTFLIEAAMIAQNIPANIHRREFAFEKWRDFDKELFERIKDAALDRERGFKYQIIGYDKARFMITKARNNAKSALLNDVIDIKYNDFFKTQKSTYCPTTLIFNPPYGKKLQNTGDDFYAKIGDTLKQNYPDSSVWFITSDIEELKKVGLRTSKKLKLYNGKLECRLVKYDMYRGTKKIKKN